MYDAIHLLHSHRLAHTQILHMNTLMHIHSLKNRPSETQALKRTVMQKGGPAGSGPVNTSQTVLSLAVQLSWWNKYGMPS